MYAKDISRKIISAFRTKQKNGEYIGLVAPFGYLKSEDNKNKFVIDGQTAPVVQMIFRWYADGKGLDSIARTLNEMDIDCPRKYRYRIGVTISDRYKDSRWGRSAVKTILTNRAYIGDMVQGKVKQELCNNISKQYVAKEEWIVAENTHEPIVDRELCIVCDLVICRAAHELIPLKGTERPDWCPLRELPEENHNNNECDEYLDGYDAGWNACLEEIGGEK